MHAVVYMHDGDNTINESTDGADISVQETI